MTPPKTKKQGEALGQAFSGGLTRRTKAGETAGATAAEDMHMATMRVPAALWRQFKARAAIEGVSVQELGRRAMEQLLAEPHDGK